MATKTNSGLIEYAAAQVGKPYWYGCYGQTATAALYASKKAQYPSYYTASDFTSQYGKRVHDCAGLIKGYLWSTSATATPVYKSSQDKSAAGMYSAATTKGKIATFDKVNGRLVFKGSTAAKISHVGVYADGYVYEAKGHAYGVLKTVYSASDWTFWCQHPDIECDTETGTTTTTTSSSTTTSTTTTASSEVTASAKAQSYLKSLAGTYTVTATNGLNVRDGAGTHYDVLVAIPCGTAVTNYGYYTTYSGTKWLYVQFTYGGVKYTGFASSAYLAK